MRSPKIIFLFLLLISGSFSLMAQNADSLLKGMPLSPDSGKIEATFKSTRLVMLQTNETQSKHDLNFMIGHHFGDIGGRFGGSHTLFGLDVASDIFFGFDYGISDKLTVGIARSRANELYNAFVKYKLIQQQTQGSPLGITLLAQPAIIARKPVNADEFSGTADRLSYALQAILARKFSSRFSFMASPGYLIRNHIDDASDKEGLFYLGLGGRLKFAKRFSLIADYVLVNGLSRPAQLTNERYFNPLGLGLEIETGGHVFSLNFMNAEYIVENNFVPYTKKSWEDGGVRFAFTISRNFTLFRQKDSEIKSKIY